MVAFKPTFNFLSIQYVCLLLLAAARRSLLKGNFVLGHRRKRGRERALGKHQQKNLVKTVHAGAMETRARNVSAGRTCGGWLRRCRKER